MIITANSKGDNVLYAIKFFSYQLFACLGWVLTLGALGFVIADGDQIMAVLQGWGPGEHCEMNLSND